MPYIRKAHDRIVRGKVVHVRAAKGKGPYTGPKIGPLAKGTLSKFGYKAYASDRVRRAALVKAIAAYGPLVVFRKLGAIMVLQKRLNPSLSNIYRSNRNFVGRKAGYGRK
jgi:Family of unknown function (DUF5771)